MTTTKWRTVLENAENAQTDIAWAINGARANTHKMARHRTALESDILAAITRIDTELHVIIDDLTIQCEFEEEAKKQ